MTRHEIEPGVFRDSGFVHKTRAEQRLEHLESLKRPLTDEESDELRRSLHAVYTRAMKCRADKEAAGKVLEKHRAEEIELLDQVGREAGQ